MTELKRFRKRVYCRICKHKTNHGIVVQHSISGDHEEAGFSWSEDYIIAQCLGCETLTFIKEYDDSTMHFYVHDENEQIDFEDIQVFPPEPLTDKDNRNKYKMKKFKHLPELLAALYEQVVANYELKYYLLAGAGLRMIIEGICNDLSIKNGYVTDDNTGLIVLDKDNNQVRSGNLNGKINGLAEQGVLTASQTVILHMIRKLGNQTVHKLNNPPGKIIFSGLEIVENTLTNIYELKKFDSIIKYLKM
ncbi:DUF4145 domain-containing protein [Ectobacillus sp. sgz5001026]|uniref:DUF4145 domain-containing protein n=1 Tax=Ectobacillus sp. sgz5001026 TaxID=3242473 RepID=UPI0036D3F394